MTRVYGTERCSYAQDVHVPTRAYEVTVELSDGTRHTFRTAGRELPTAQPGQTILDVLVLG